MFVVGWECSAGKRAASTLNCIADLPVWFGGVVGRVESAPSQKLGKIGGEIQYVSESFSPTIPKLRPANLTKPDWTIGDLTLAFKHMTASNTALLLLTLRLTRG